ncbi:hypothetical protein GJAV_G00171590 [Gymnothorax javanicus]|nr:hypothetical protein GJAV_G00171590 [Gymnothorax javanicus]
MFNTERAALLCQIQDLSPVWRYKWYRDGKALPVGTDNHTYEILSAAQSDSGTYSCRGEHKDRGLYTDRSSTVTLSVSAPPSAVLTVQPVWNKFYTSEKVTLTCEVQWRLKKIERRYVWYRDGKSVHTGPEKEFMIQALDQSHSGSYSCVGVIPGRIPLRNGRTEESKKVTLSVDALPSAVLTVQPVWSTFYTSEKVTLTCEVQWRLRKIERRYVWYRNGTAVHTGPEKEFMIQILDQSHSGSYSCVGVIPGRIPLRNGLTEESNQVTLSVDALPPVALTLQTGWTDMFNTERAALLCQIQDLSPVWMYKWYRDGKALPVGTDNHTYEILSAAQSDSGTYSCRGEHKDRGLYTDRSSTVSLSVSALPPVALTLQTGWTDMFNTERAALLCQIQDLSPVWMYKWYRDGKALPVGTDKHTYEILSAAPSDSGTYSCRGEHKDRGLYTDSSSTVSLSVSGNTPKPLMTLDPSRPEIFTGDTVMLSCAVSGNATGWQYQWYRGTRKTALTSTDSPNTDGSIYRISSAAESHRGEYWCRAVRGTPHFYTPHSDPLRLNITARPVAVLTLQTPWTGIFRTDSLTLRCSVERNFTGWNYTWYRDGQPLKIDKDTLTLKPENGTDRSEYRCRGSSTGYPSYTDISEAFREHNIVLKRKVLVSVASTVLLGILIIILGCIALRVRRKSAYKTAPQNDFFISSRPSENLGSNSEHFSNEKPSADIEDACNIELYSIVDLDTEKEVLPSKRDPEELQSFKAIV